MNSLLFQARTHQIDDMPNAEMALRFGRQESPNACLQCHADKDAAWLAAELRRREAPLTPADRSNLEEPTQRRKAVWSVPSSDLINQGMEWVVLFLEDTREICKVEA